VHFQDHEANGGVDYSDHHEEEAHDIVHDLLGDVPGSATMVQGESALDSNIDYRDNRKRAKSSQNMSTKISKERHVSEEVTVKVTPYIVKMELSLEDFGKHVHEANVEFKENVLKKVQSIKAKDTIDLTKKVEELKVMEASELSKLNKGYLESDLKAKKIDRKVS